MTRIAEDLSGRTFGRLIVLGRDYSRGGRAAWRCLCSCESRTEWTALGDNIRSGGTRSCGCLHREQLRARATTHAESTVSRTTPEYVALMGMVTRCENRETAAFAHYGARGIKVCAGIRHDVTKFIATVGRRPAKGWSIDRIDVDGHYSCGDCDECLSNGWGLNMRWADRATQARNRTDNVFIDYGGRRMCLKDWAAELGINYLTLRSRLVDSGWSVEKAFETPVRRWPSQRGDQ